MNTAYLKVTQYRNPLGKIETINFEWEGNSPYTWVDRTFLGDLVGLGDDRARVQVGPYKLLKIEYDYQRDAFLCVRADKFGALRIALYKSTRLLGLIYRRLIITLAVWRLAEFHEATVPTWKDIKVLKRFVK